MFHGFAQPSFQLHYSENLHMWYHQTGITRHWRSLYNDALARCWLGYEAASSSSHRKSKQRSPRASVSAYLSHNTLMIWLLFRYDVNEMLDGRWFCGVSSTTWLITHRIRLDVVAFPFIGGTVPEGHQGQSIQGDCLFYFFLQLNFLFVKYNDDERNPLLFIISSGMSHGAILSRLKTGFHRLRIPWGHNADHQPVGGKFTSREHALAAGCVLASYLPLIFLNPIGSFGFFVTSLFGWPLIYLNSVVGSWFFNDFWFKILLTFSFLRYITFDISFSLLDPSAEELKCPHDVVTKIVHSLAPLALRRDEIEAESHALWPAMVAMKRRDMLYKCARDLITPGEDLFLIFVAFPFVYHFFPSLRIGFRTNVIFPRALHRWTSRVDFYCPACHRSCSLQRFRHVRQFHRTCFWFSEELSFFWWRRTPTPGVAVQWAHSSVSLIDETSQVGAAWPVCRLFNCSIGFHSGSGESFFFISCSQVSALTWFFVFCRKIIWKLFHLRCHHQLSPRNQN